MATTATTYPRGWVAARVQERNLSAAGLGLASMKVSVEQLTSQAAGQLLHDLGNLLNLLPVGRIHLLDLLFSELATLLSVLNGLPSGPLSMLVTLVLPVGGPLWAGVIPVGTTVKGVRGAGRLLARVRIPASSNASARSIGQAGVVTMTIVIVDDSRPFLEVARRLLVRDGLEVVALASTGAEAAAQVEALRPQVVLIDLHLVGESGFDVARRVAGCGLVPAPSVVLMSTHAEEEFADLIAASAVAGFIAKERLSGDAVRAVVAGAGS
ncbi:response regulator [Nocardioides sp.]|uniref:response regulator n=1 Tax=Nocardioides sp. TaxID=35761 RepID=UPI003D0BBCF0